MNVRQLLSGKQGTGQGGFSQVSVILQFLSAGVMSIHLICFMTYK